MQAAPPSAIDKETSELAALERVADRVTNTPNTQFAPLLHKLVPSLINLFMNYATDASNNNRVQQKAMEILSGALRRLQVEKCETPVDGFRFLLPILMLASPDNISYISASSASSVNNSSGNSATNSARTCASSSSASTSNSARTTSTPSAAAEEAAITA